jgi:hypothetical protein
LPFRRARLPEWNFHVQSLAEQGTRSADRSANVKRTTSWARLLNRNLSTLTRASMRAGTRSMKEALKPVLAWAFTAKQFGPQA